MCPNVVIKGLATVSTWMFTNIGLPILIHLARLFRVYLRRITDSLGCHEHCCDQTAFRLRRRPPHALLLMHPTVTLVSQIVATDTHPAEGARQFRLSGSPQRHRENRISIQKPGPEAIPRITEQKLRYRILPKPML